MSNEHFISTECIFFRKDKLERFSSRCCIKKFSHYLMVLSIYRYQNDPKLLLLSDLMESEEADVSGGEFQSTKNGFTHLILQDLFASDFQMAEIDRDENGLDFTHTILALAKLATFHAVSYCMKREKNIDFHERYNSKYINLLELFRNKFTFPR